MDVDLRAAVRFHRERGAIATIILRDVPQEEVFRYGVVETAPDGKILQFQEKPLSKKPSRQRSTREYTCSSRQYSTTFLPGCAFDIGGELFPALVACGAPMYGMNLPFSGSTSVPFPIIGKRPAPAYWAASLGTLPGT